MLSDMGTFDGCPCAAKLCDARFHRKGFGGAEEPLTPKVFSHKPRASVAVAESFMYVTVINVYKFPLVFVQVSPVKKQLTLGVV